MNHGIIVTDLTSFQYVFPIINHMLINIYINDEIKSITFTDQVNIKELADLIINAKWITIDNRAIFQVKNLIGIEYKIYED